MAPKYTYDEWSAGLNTSTNGAPNLAYQNYYLSGNDIIVGLVPYYNRTEIIPLPVTEFAFGISQEKVPIYSAFSYKFDAVAKGVKIVRGEFSIVFSKPNHIGQLLGSPSLPDYPELVNEYGSSHDPIPAVNSDQLVNYEDELRSKFWGTDKAIETHHGNLVKATERTGPYNQVLVDPGKDIDSYSNREYPAFPFGRDSIPSGYSEADYAGHQPFDLVIIMGTTIDTRRRNNSGFNGYGKWVEGILDDDKNYGKANVNDEFYERSDRIIIKNVELMSCGIGFDPSGQPLRESYSFIARDAVVGV